MDIRHIVKTLIQLMTNLSNLLDQEKDLLIKDNGAEIVKIVETKKQLLMQISQLEISREKSYGSKPLTEFMAQGLIDPKEGEHLIKLAEEVGEKNEVNSLLTRQSLNYIRMMTSILNPRPKAPTYGNNGKIQGNSPNGLFTTSV